jgi:hypothetical protein
VAVLENENMRLREREQALMDAVGYAICPFGCASACLCVCVCFVADRRKFGTTLRCVYICVCSLAV